PVDPDHATGVIKRIFAEIRANFALVPNLFRVLVNAPMALDGIVGLGATLARGALDEKTREQLALAIAEGNLCAYCLSAHTAMPEKVGLSRAQIDDAIRASATDSHTKPSSNLPAASLFSVGNSPTQTSRAPVQSA